MGRSSRRKEKHEKVGELPQHDSNEGTSARTRPFNYDEIMSKRNSKKVNEKVESVKEGNTELRTIEKDSLIHKDFNVNRYDGGNGHGKESSVGHERHLLGKREKKSSHKKIENADRRNDSISKQKARENHEPERRLKSEVRKDTDVKDESKYEKQIHVKRKTEKTAGGSEKVYTKKRDLVERDRHVNRNEGKSERDEKRKHQTRDDEENRERNTARKHETRKGHAIETSDRKEKKEPSRSHHDDSNHKRRRSQSREHEDRHRRSISLSPRVRKRASHHVLEHDLSSHGVKARSGKHSDDRSRMTSNGSGGHHRRHGGSSSGLGGYSPRKRKTEASVRTPSPVHRSTEKRTAKWDLAPAETENMVSGSASSNLQASSQMVSINMHAIVNAVPSVSVIGNPLVVSSTGSLSFDSVQLTEATRPLRRLYVENVPASASEKAMMESFNNFLLSSGINHIRGTKPCISCIVSL